MNCTEAKSFFSPYLDGVLTGTQMLGLSRHLEGCATCTENYISLRRTQQLLSSAGTPQSPGRSGFEAAGGNFGRGGAF